MFESIHVSIRGDSHDSVVFGPRPRRHQVPLATHPKLKPSVAERERDRRTYLVRNDDSKLSQNAAKKNESDVALVSHDAGDVVSVCCRPAPHKRLEVEADEAKLHISLRKKLLDFLVRVKRENDPHDAGMPMAHRQSELRSHFVKHFKGDHSHALHAKRKQDTRRIVKEVRDAGSGHSGLQSRGGTQQKHEKPRGCSTDTRSTRCRWWSPGALTGYCALYIHVRVHFYTCMERQSLGSSSCWVSRRGSRLRSLQSLEMLSICSESLPVPEGSDASLLD